MMVRITKYNPIFRDSQGNYIKEEWTSPSDIGRSFEGKELTIEKYLKTEQSYIVAIKNILELFGIKELMVTNFTAYDKNDKPINLLSRETSREILEGLLELIHPGLQQSSLQILTNINIYDGKVIRLADVSDIIKLSLREIVGFQLSSEDETYVHFGYDYYVYIGSEKSPLQNSLYLPQGVFVEWCPSPYL